MKTLPNFKLLFCLSLLALTTQAVEIKKQVKLTWKYPKGSTKNIQGWVLLRATNDMVFRDEKLFPKYTRTAIVDIYKDQENHFAIEAVGLGGLRSGFINWTTIVPPPKEGFISIEVYKKLPPPKGKGSYASP